MGSLILIVICGIFSGSKWDLIPWPKMEPRSRHWECGVLTTALEYFRTSLVAQLIKNLPAMQKTWVQSLSWEDPLEEGMATHSSILAWKIPWTEEPGSLQSVESQSDTTEQLRTAEYFIKNSFSLLLLEAWGNFSHIFTIRVW